MSTPSPSTTESSAAPERRGARLRAHQQRLYPQRLLCALMHRATRIRFRPWKDWQIRWFVARYGVDLAEALEADSCAYPDFNHFFTRELRPEARPVDEAPEAIVSPCDGTVSAAGALEAGTLVQAKDHRYGLRALLGGADELAERFAGGRFATVYLSPRDYHRVHMPLDGRLREMIHVPGRLLSVNPATVRHVPELFSRNERVVSLFDTDQGPLAVVLVGALFVGGIEQVWSGPVTPTRRRTPSRWRYPGDGDPLTLARGAEMGRFNMGSTVVVIVGNREARWSEDLVSGRPVRMGQRLGTVARAAQT